MITDNKACLDAISLGFVASCQPVDFGPMDKPEIVARMARACIAGGATALRIEGLENLKATRTTVNVPIIGIIKRDLIDTEIRITPFIEDVLALKQAGADIIAIDATDRPRPVSIEKLVNTIHSLDCLVMADCSNYAEGMYCQSLGVDIIGTTLSGYTGTTIPKDPDYELVKKLSKQGCFVMAEGRYNSPELAQKAIESGASSVTIGSAITRLEHISSWFRASVDAGRANKTGLTA